jgi:hypothetical protein
MHRSFGIGSNVLLGKEKLDLMAKSIYHQFMDNLKKGEIFKGEEEQEALRRQATLCFEEFYLGASSMGEEVEEKNSLLICSATATDALSPSLANMQIDALKAVESPKSTNSIADVASQLMSTLSKLPNSQGEDRPNDSQALSTIFEEEDYEQRKERVQFQALGNNLCKDDEKETLNNSASELFSIISQRNEGVSHRDEGAILTSGIADVERFLVANAIERLTVEKKFENYFEKFFTECFQSSEVMEQFKSIDWFGTVLNIGKREFD